MEWTRLLNKQWFLIFLPCRAVFVAKLPSRYYCAGVHAPLKANSSFLFIVSQNLEALGEISNHKLTSYLVYLPTDQPIANSSLSSHSTPNRSVFFAPVVRTSHLARAFRFSSLFSLFVSPFAFRPQGLNNSHQTEETKRSIKRHLAAPLRLRPVAPQFFVLRPIATPDGRLS